MIVSSDEGTFAYMRMVLVDPWLRVKLLTTRVDLQLLTVIGWNLLQFDPAQDSGDITFNYTVTDGETDPVAASATLHVRGS